MRMPVGAAHGFVAAIIACLKSRLVDRYTTICSLSSALCKDKVINRSYLNPKRKTHRFCETCIQLPYASKYALRSLVHGPSNQN